MAPASHLNWNKGFDTEELDQFNNKILVFDEESGDHILTATAEDLKEKIAHLVPDSFFVLPHGSEEIKDRSTSSLDERTPHRNSL